jgi:hypothetical protein
LKIKIGIIAAIFYLLPGVVSAYDLLIKPMAIYEGASENIVIDGVSTGYALGVVGISAQSQITANLSVGGSLGYGYAKDQDLSFYGATFSGAVEGEYSKIFAKQIILEGKKFKTYAQYSYTNKALEYANLVGARGGLSLTGDASTTIQSSDFLINVEFIMSKNTIVQASAGVSDWNLSSSGNAYYSSNGLSAAASKNIDAKGFDPLFAVSSIHCLQYH